jgi:glycine cleavage system protein P-like pyridoxal-binding family
MAGVQVDDHTLMLAVTEQRTKEEIDELVETIKQIREEKA